MTGNRDDAGSDPGLGEEPGSGPGRAPTARAGRGRLVTAAVLASLMIGVAGFVVGSAIAAGGKEPSTSGAEAGFARDMQTHHNQAVEMAMIVRDNTTDPDIRNLAYDIATSQAQQSGQMYAWLNAWGLPQASPDAPMAWMASPPPGGGAGHGHGEPTANDGLPGSGAMPGMATESELALLRSSSGAEADRLFLTLMIAHHKGGVEMADAVLARSEHPLVTSLAKAIVFSQAGEIDYMEGLLADRG